MPPIKTREDFLSARSVLRTQGIDTLRTYLQGSGVVMGSKRLSSTHNVFSRLSSRLTIDSRAGPMNNTLTGTPFVAAYNRRDCDDNWDNESPEWVGRASMSRRHRLLLLDDPDWTTFNALTLGMGAAEECSGLRAAVATLEAMKAAAFALAANEPDWPQESVGLYFHVFPHNSVQALHLHLIDLAETGPTFAALSYKNFALDDALFVLRSELATCEMRQLPAAHLACLPPAPCAQLCHTSAPVQSTEGGSDVACLDSSPRYALAIGLGGGSDSIGALALAHALGYQAILVQPGCCSAETASAVHCVDVVAMSTPAVPPGSEFHRNSSMLAYLLSLPPAIAPAAAYYLNQPKDAASQRGFSAAALQATTDVYLDLARKHGCSAIIGLDFGGDVMLSTTGHIAGSGDTCGEEALTMQRDTLNLQASASVAGCLGIGATLVAVAPGADAAAVAAEYAELLMQRPLDRVLAMGTDDNRPMSLSPSSVEQPRCSLPALPSELKKLRIQSNVQDSFVSELRRLSARIAFDANIEVLKEHAYKTCVHFACLLEPID